MSLESILKIPRILSSLFQIAMVIATVSAFSNAAIAHASDMYIAQNASGANSGADCADAHAVTYFNDGSNWGAGGIGPGTTVHLCGTFMDSTPGDTLLTVQGSGSSGNPITILFENGATLTNSAYWGSNGAILVSGKSWVTIDGQKTGVIQNAGNGTGLAYEAQSTGVILNSTNNVTVQNLQIVNVCRHTSNTDTHGCASGGSNDQAVKIMGGAANLLFQGNVVHDSQNCIEFYGSAGDTVTIKNNTLSRCNWEIGGYGLSASLTIIGNDISGNPGGANPWGTTSDSYHNNGVMLFPQSGNMNGVVIANNYIHDVGGTTGSSGTETGHIFLDPNAPGNIPNILIYNNVLTTSGSSSYGPTNAYITDGRGVSGAGIYNNTIAGSGANAGSQCISAQMTSSIKNNICTGMQVGEWLNSGYAVPASNYNDWYGLTSNGAGIMCVNDGSKCDPTLSAWVSTFNLDANSISANPSLTANFTLGSSSQATGKGVNLSSLGIAGLTMSSPESFGASYSCGSGCLARPGSGAWDIGAYERGGATSPVVAPPVSLVGQVVPAP